LRLHRAVGEEAMRYNLLQKLAYLLVIFGLLPLMVLTGLTMSNVVESRSARAPQVSHSDHDALLR
jgi:thiosulfate reductase cytochrome b subunit